MSFFKNLELEIREMDFAGMTALAIADCVGLDVPQVLAILDDIEEVNPTEYAEYAADLDADYYGRM